MSRSKSTRTPRASPHGESRSIRLRPENPFDLIRLIAHSQSDPRKALAELVQNSLDAGATQVTVTRWRRDQDLKISILDDGRGIFPDLERPEALERIATNIGHSFKRNLSAAERQREMLLGKYGIGILGFWAVGRELEMRSRTGGSEVWALRLVRDQPLAEVSRVRERRIAFPGETWTEVVIHGVHAGAARQTVGRKLGDYLGSELRGQLLERGVKLRLVDKIARGRAPKDFAIVPQRFRGRRVPLGPELTVTGFAAARLEIYHAVEEREDLPRIALTCGGTVVCEDLSRVEGYDLDRPPWSSGSFEGIVEFPDLEVAPATRRGIIPNPAADAFFAALKGIESALLAVIVEERDKRRAEVDESVAREIRKVFRPLAKKLPQYDFFEVRARPAVEEDGRGDEGRDGAAKLGRTGDDGGAGSRDPPDGQEPEPASEVIEEGDLPEPEAEILPPGPLAAVRIAPRKSRLLLEASRGLRAKAVDGTGRAIGEGIVFSWTLVEGDGALTTEGDRAVFTAPDRPAAARVAVEARQGEMAATAEAEIEVVEKLAGERPDAGIPEPRRAFDPAGDWRSRVSGRSWEYNAAHPDYQAVEDDARRRFRYLVHLFAKEIVLRNYGEPKDERLLERVVEVLTHIGPRV